MTSAIASAGRTQPGARALAGRYPRHDQTNLRNPAKAMSWLQTPA